MSLPTSVTLRPAATRELSHTDRACLQRLPFRVLAIAGLLHTALSPAVELVLRYVFKPEPPGIRPQHSVFNAVDLAVRRPARVGAVNPALQGRSPYFTTDRGFLLLLRHALAAVEERVWAANVVHIIGDQPGRTLAREASTAMRDSRWPAVFVEDDHLHVMDEEDEWPFGQAHLAGWAIPRGRRPLGWVFHGPVNERYDHASRIAAAANGFDVDDPSVSVTPIDSALSLPPRLQRYTTLYRPRTT